MKTKSGFFNIDLKGVYFLEQYDGLFELITFVQKWGIFQIKIDQMWDNKLWLFLVQKWMSQTIRPQIVLWKKVRSFV